MIDKIKEAHNYDTPKSRVIEMINYLIDAKKACKLTIHIAPGFIAKIEIPNIFKLENWEKNLK